MENLLENKNVLADWKREVLENCGFQISDFGLRSEIRNQKSEMGRRGFLRAAALGTASLAVSAAASAAPTPDPDGPKAVKTGTFYFPRLMFHVKDETGDQWNIYPVGDVILRKRLRQLSNVNASEDPIVVRLADLANTCRYPFVFATSEGYFDLPDNEAANLKEFLLRGGFVYADDCVLGKTGDRFFKDYVRIVNRLFEKEGMAMQRVPNDHEINRCYFEFPNGAPFIQGVNHGAYALFEKGTGRLMTYLTPGDLHCGWTCQWNTAEQNEAALRMGINIIIYYLTH